MTPLSLFWQRSDRWVQLATGEAGKEGRGKLGEDLCAFRYRNQSWGVGREGRRVGCLNSISGHVNLKCVLQMACMVAHNDFFYFFLDYGNLLFIQESLQLSKCLG